MRKFIAYWPKPWSMRRGKLDGRRKAMVREVLDKLYNMDSEFFDLNSPFRKSVQVFRVRGTSKLEIYYTLGYMHKYMGYRIVIHCDRARSYTPFSVFAYDDDRYNYLVYNF